MLKSQELIKTPVSNFFGARNSSKSKFSSNTPKQHAQLNLPSVSPLMKYEDDGGSKLRSTASREQSRNPSPFSLNLEIKLEDRTSCCEDPPTPKFNFPSIYVSRWVDYSSKYGLGFQLSDTSVGVLFNDNTKIVQDAEKTSYVIYVDKEGKKNRYDIAKYPEEMRKKITLYLHFRKFFRSKALKSLCQLRQNLAALDEDFLLSDKLELL